MRVRLRLIAPLLALGLLLPSIALAATVEDLVSLAQTTFGMRCSVSSNGTAQVCLLRTPAWVATISPASGTETNLTTSVPTTSVPLAPTSPEHDFFFEMHSLACGDPKNVDSFVISVLALKNSGDVITATIGSCEFRGSLNGGALAPYTYQVDSAAVASPSPSVPASTPTAPPTAKPTPAPTPQATASPAATPITAPSASPAPSETPAAFASAVPSATPRPSPTLIVEPAATEPAATAGSGAPTASQPPTGVGTGGGGPGGGEAPTFSQSVLGVTDVSTEIPAVGANALLALLMLLIIGFAGELFNNTVENNYDTISGWFRKGPLGTIRRALGRLGSSEGRIPVLAFVALTALISSFVDPTFGVNLRSVAEFLGFLVGLVVVLASFKLPPMLAHRRRTGELGRLRPLPWALVIAAVFVLVSRLGNLQPGYLYGIVLGAIFVKDVSDEEEGRETFYGSIWTLVAAFLSWVALAWLREQGLPSTEFGATLASTAFAAILVSGLEATAFGLMPLRFMPGYAIYRWNRLGWALLFGLSIFAFVHILIGPTSGYVSQLTPQAWVAALGVFAAFGALSIGTWAYFRFMRPSATVEEIAEAG